MEGKQELVKQARRGDAHAFALLYEDIYEDLYRYAYYMLQNQQDAEDAVSEGVLAAFSGIGRLRRAEAFRGWMFQIMTNICKRKRKEYMNKHISLDGAKMAQHSDGNGANVDVAKCAGDAYDIQNALRYLSEEERQIIGMSVLAGYTSEEIGRILHMKAGSVRSKLSRSLGKLRKLLGEAV